jgi:hypothetical protein
MTSKMHRPRKKLLEDLLSSILNEWGEQEVLRVIAELQTSPLKKSSDQRPSGANSQGRSHQRPSAISIAQKADAPAEKKRLLIDLASNFDHKSFLPTMPDIRHFLEMRGQELGVVKQRADAFRSVVKVMLAMSDEGLERLVRNIQHTGPSQLGPLSDAIKSTGAIVRQDRSDNNPTAQGEVIEPAATEHATRSGAASDQPPVGTASEASSGEERHKRQSRNEQARDFSRTASLRREEADSQRQRILRSLKDTPPKRG